MAWFVHLKYWDNETRRIDLFPCGSVSAELAISALRKRGTPFIESKSFYQYDPLAEFDKLRGVLDSEEIRPKMVQ